MTLLLALSTAVLFACGTYLLLQRELSRIVIGVGLLGHGANLMLLQSAGGRGGPAFIGSGDAGSFTDPLPQALMLTAIVITFGLTVFLLALAFRSWIVSHDDHVEDDVEDRLISRRDRRVQAGAARDLDGEPDGDGSDAARADRSGPDGDGAVADATEDGESRVPVAPEATQ